MTIVNSGGEFPHRWREEIWQQRNLEAVDELVAPDFVGRSPGLPEPIRGREGVREFVEMTHGAFPDLEVTIEDVVADGEQVTVRQTLAGTHEGPFLGVEPTGEAVEVAHVSFLQIDDGQLAGEWEMADHLRLFEQMGLVDPPTG